MITYSSFTTYLAWEFSTVLPGTFKRNKKQFAHHNYPILAPLPSKGSSTRPIEECKTSGPFIYFVLDRQGRLCYIGKSQEKCVLQRWIRPDNSTPKRHFWTHSTASGGNVFNIAQGIERGEGPYTLRYAPLSSMLPIAGKLFAIDEKDNEEKQLTKMEVGLLTHLRPIWNR